LFLFSFDELKFVVLRSELVVQTLRKLRIKFILILKEMYFEV